MSARSQGNVYYNNDEVMHVKSFRNADGTLCQQDARTRFAYLIVSKAEALEVAGSLKDDKAVVDAVKGKYASLLSQAIEIEKTGVLRTQKLLDHRYILNSKLIHTFSVPARNASCEALFLKGIKFAAASKNVDASKKVSGDKKNFSYLKKNLSECKRLLEMEHREVGRKELDEPMRRPYALVSVPYVYNARYDDKGTKSYECTAYDAEVCVSLMPKVRVEYGVFFDGTNNNMYNIDFYQDYKKLVTEQSKTVREKAKPYGGRFDRAIGDDIDPIDYIATHPDPVKDPRVMKNLRNEIVSNVRYFEESSTLKNRYGNDKASKDAEKVFDFLKEVRDTVSDKDESWLEVGLEKVVRGYESVTGTAEEIKQFLIDHILPDDGEGSSYVNGYTNIKRLYDHYEGGDRLNSNADRYDLKRFKLYASGSGTTDPTDRGRLDDDEVTGLGLGTGDTGVKAHVVYACEKIARELNAGGIEYVDELVLDVFGFSRGATEARHFVCSIHNAFDLLGSDDYAPYTLSIAPDESETDLFAPFFEHQNGERAVFEGVVHINPIRGIADQSNRNTIVKKPAPPLHIENVSLRHVNIGDTVTHHGLVQSDDFKELNISFLPEKVGSVYHVMAMDEYRYNFDAYSIFDDDYDDVKRGASGDKLREVVVPGAHADVGGGYQNAPGEETVHLMSSIVSTAKKAKAWNGVYHWLPGEQNVQVVKKRDAMNEAGLYEVVNHTGTASIDRHDIYMKRTALTWLYELVTLRLMHDEAVDKKQAKEERERVPLQNLLPEYDLAKLKNSGAVNAEDCDFLAKIYKQLAKDEPLEKTAHQKLRQRFMHHSSSLGIVNKPSQSGNRGNKDEVYGRRAIYGAGGEDFSLLPGLAARLAR